MNRLANETSPYLLQHADNPVHWYPWCDEAFETASREGKPVLLSVGYSACHWCHVMAHESFEDPATAKIMNRHFINIKVDREERPDVDRIYQTAHHLIARRAGGWPLTVFLTPDGKLPFFAGTYFPDKPRHGMPAFADLLEKVAAYVAANPDEVTGNGQAVVEALGSTEPEAAGIDTVVDGVPITGIREQLAADFDRENGGFGGAPKFPHAGNLERLLRHWRGTATETEPDVDALFMCALTLKRMGDGGIYDHLGGGFCRYAVDGTWTIPHFEKMLYDNGPLLALYSQIWQASGDDEFRRIATETADWVLRDMRSPEGGFYSTLDADSEGEEGRFYVWSPDKIARLLSDEQNAIVSAHYGLDGPPNFEGKHWHLCVRRSLDEVAKANGVTEPAARSTLDQARARLLEARGERIWPGRDEKILTAWNALMIRGLAIAADPLDRPELAEAAAIATDFITERMITNGQLLASFKNGRARFPAYLDDYAYLLDALIELLQSRWDAQHLGLAIWAAEQLLSRFQDNERGGFFFTAHDHEELVHRPRPFADEATPSGNGVAALSLNRLGYLLGEARYLDAAQATLRAAWNAMQQYPHGHATLITALEEFLTPPETIIVRGSAGDIERWRRVLRSLYAPRRIVLAIPDDEDELPGALAARVSGPEPLAYVCRGTVCDAPFESLEGLLENLRGSD